MKRIFNFNIIFLLLVFVVNVANGQTPTSANTKPSMIVGEVTSIDGLNKKMTIKTKDGDLTVVLSEKTEYLKVQPGATTLAGATTITIAEIGLGDGIIANGVLDDVNKLVPAKKLILMSKADIAKKQEAEREEWRRRGIAGRITQLNISKYEVTIAVNSLTGETFTTLVNADKAKFLRYSPDSVKFSDAKESSFLELKVGDQLRALGTKGEEGKIFTPEEVISGSFKTIAGTVTEVDTATGEVKIKSLENEKLILTVVISKDTVIRRLPQQMMGFLGGQMGQNGQGGQQVMMRPQGTQGGQTGGQGGQRQGGQQGNQQSGQQGNQQAGQGGQRPGGQQAGGPRAFGGGNFDINEMIERLPAIPITDLKVGDMIGASSSVGDDPTRYKAIKLLAGVEPLVRLGQMQQAQRQATGGGSPSLNLPGLDGIGIP